MPEMKSVQKDAVLRAAIAIGEAIRDLGSVPSGHLYARMMGDMSLSTYQFLIALLKDAGVVKEENHLLIWTGPKVADMRNVS